jgi:glutamate-1-semialdehyde 2,1-aminomutase/spore coat polysaccharide biosynthesis protein SpsF
MIYYKGKNMEEKNLQKSEQLFTEAKSLVPGGIQKSRHPSVFIPGFYPIFMQRGKGSHIFDVDENEYIDWLLGYGPIVLGHCYPRVDEAVIKEIGKGFLLTFVKPVQNELARKLIEIVPCAEQVIFLKTGSEATSAAIRIARVYSGKDKVVRWGFHGWHDWAYGGEGVPENVLEDVLSFRYNDLESLEKILEKNKNQVACVIMMPLEIEMPSEGFLKGVRDLTEANKVVLIFDEIRTGFRMALGGAQEYFGVTPDLATFSKGIANGYPLSVVAGKKEIMAAVERTLISGTFFPDSLAIIAALETIRELEQTDGIKHMWDIGKMLMDGIKELISMLHIEAKVIGVSPMPYLLFGGMENYGGPWRTEKKESNQDDGKARIFRDTFYAETVKRGVLLHPYTHWLTCLSHSKEDVEKTLQAVEKALHVVHSETYRR